MSIDPKIDRSVSAIIPTIGRAESLTLLLNSLAAQTLCPDEVIVADASDQEDVAAVVRSSDWSSRGLSVRHLRIRPPNAVRQRRAAIKESWGGVLLLLDDDVVLEPDCLEKMIDALHSAPEVVAVTADFNNQTWSGPTTLWRCYLRWGCGLAEGQWQGRVIGPLLRFGYNPVPDQPLAMEWLGAGNSLIKRSAYDSVGGFSDFFLHRCTMNEDVDLGLKLCRVGRILFCPAARMAHYHAPGGRVSAAIASEDDIYNRFLVLRRTCRLSGIRTFGLVSLFLLIETGSHFLGSVKRASFRGFFPLLLGRLRGMVRVVFTRPILENDHV
jgi:GT2 family glycosyltransferase